MPQPALGIAATAIVIIISLGCVVASGILATRRRRAIIALFLALLLVTRGTSALLWIREFDSRGTVSLALFAATGLPLIVAIVGIGEERGDISKAVGASLIGAGMLSVLIYPFVAARLAARFADAEAPVPSQDGTGEY